MLKLAEDFGDEGLGGLEGVGEFGGVFAASLRLVGFAAAALAALNESGALRQPVVTQVAPTTTFYPAEAEHQNYYRRNTWAPYCRRVIRAKLEKLRNYGIQP